MTILSMAAAYLIANTLLACVSASAGPGPFHRGEGPLKFN
jgi:hypothetical protein